MVCLYFSIFIIFPFFSFFLDFLRIFRIFHFPRFQWHNIIDQKLEFLSRLKARFSYGFVQKLCKNGGSWTIFSKIFLFAEGVLKATERLLCNIFSEKGPAKTFGFRGPNYFSIVDGFPVNLLITIILLCYIDFA